MNTNSRTSPKDFFLHLGATIALYVSVIALINLAFAVVNRAMPDALNAYFSASSVAWPISILLVIVPTLYILEKFINRDMVRMIEKRDIWIRKWRIYLTLFLTGATIAVDVIVLINTYLNGEISSRFIWKVLIVLIVSAVVFAYYIMAKSTSVGMKGTWLNALAILGIVLVVAGIISGFIIVGSPSTQRAMRFDEQRVNDLGNIQYQITNYWQKTGTLPSSLQALNDPISSFSVPNDPETGKPYEYISLNRDPHAFALCAIFGLPSDGTDSKFSQPVPMANPIDGRGFGDSWVHTAGYVCFERTIDPKLYPQINTK